MSRAPDERAIAGLSPSEKRALLARLLRERGGRAQSATTGPLLVPGLIEAQARRRPDALVVSDDAGRRLAYAELDRRANGLAALLRDRGVGPESLVGLHLGRGTPMVVALLAVLKAGAAYLPLDPVYPAERLRFMVDDALPALVLTSGLTSAMPADGVPTLDLDALATDWPEASEPPTSNLQRASLAYVIYTSGSTGRPKGVQVTHGGLVNLTAALGPLLELSERDVFLGMTTLSFDIAVLELLLPLTLGARVHVVDRGVAADGLALARRLRDERVTILQATPATWGILLASGWKGDPTLKLISTGEALPRPLAEQLLPLGAALWNLYGPTETTVFSTASRVARGSVTIGKPIANTRVYVLDRGLRPAPLGVTGELYLGGAGLARGYLGRAGLTAERFLPDPFSPLPGARIYRTGDLARWLPDGNLECLGRVDHQVKIRGFRIELGEVEATIRRHPEVADAAVAAFEDGAGGPELVAYVVGRSVIPGADELRDWVGEHLPDYMVPSRYVELEKLPLTPSGKLDRRALPAPGISGGLREPDYVAPRGAVEVTLAGLWAGVLGRERVGVHDNFFSLGGHSLKAAHLLGRIQELYGIELSLRVLFEFPTVAGLARYLAEVSGSAADVEPDGLTAVDPGADLTELERPSDEETTSLLGHYRSGHDDVANA
jgi:amino acid adenylation domain-containing protein